MSRHLHQNVTCLICQSHMPRLARDAIANGQVMIFRKLNAIWPRKARSWNNLVKVLGLWGISRTSFHGGYTQNLKLGGLTFWNMKHQKYHTRQLQSPVETGREESPWNRIPENYPKKKAFWNPGGPVLVQNVRGLPWSFRAKLEMPIVPLGGCQVKKSYSKPSAEAENVTRGSSGRVKK